jgi:hypothetical protein
MTMKGFTVQSIDLYDDSENPICCPFCGTKIANGASEEDQWVVGECEHLLFAAHDEGFEYKSTRFEKAIEAAKAVMSEDERDELDNDHEELLQQDEYQKRVLLSLDCCPSRTIQRIHRICSA